MVSHVDADLVLASGEQGDVEPGIGVTFFDHLVIGPGLFSLLACASDGIDPQGL